MSIAGAGLQLPQSLADRHRAADRHVERAQAGPHRDHELRIGRAMHLVGDARTFPPEQENIILAEAMGEVGRRSMGGEQDKAQAFAMIQMAVENAASSDRIWIEDIYQNIFCGSPNDVRVQSQGYVANWRRSFARPRALVEAPGASRRAPR